MNQQLDHISQITTKMPNPLTVHDLVFNTNSPNLVFWVSMVVDILLLQTISIAIASASIVVAVIYYILQIQHQRKMRQTDLLVRLFSMTMTRDFVEAWEKVAQRENLDFREYREKYGLTEVDLVFWFLEQLGRLLQQGLIDIDQMPVPYGQIKVMWERIKPIAEGSRKMWSEPKVAQGFEYLYNEVKKREQPK